MTKTERFFFNNAGYSWNPKTETQKEGRARCAANLARAERYAQAQGWRYEWGPDDTPCDHERGECRRRPEYCALRNGDNELLASLSGICDADASYRRVVQAELALEAM